MPPTNALPAQGISLKRGDGTSPEQFTHVAEIMDITGPNSTVTMIEANSLDTNVAEYLAGILNSGQLTLSAILLPTDEEHAGLLDDHQGKVLRNFELHLTDSPATVLSFAAFVSAYTAPQATTDGKLQSNITLTISGAVDWGTA